jgi:catechol 2,3-dioxygenase-like lactoylglutathione lyase family enzyme
MQAGVRIRSIGPILITVANMDRSIDFYSRVLTFQKTAGIELAGEQVEHLFGLFGTRVRVVRMTLGSESIELVQFLAPHGRPIPVDSRSNDLWFQHIAVIVHDGSRLSDLAREPRGVCFSGPPTLARLEQERRGHPGFLLQRS